MVAIKSEGGGGKSKGGGNGSDGCGGTSNNNNNANRTQKSGPLHPALFMSNKRMMKILRCSEVELDLLKHGASKLVRLHPKIHYRELRWELSEQDDEWEEMLSGERWEEEDYPFLAGFEKDVEHIIIKIKSLASCALKREKNKREKRRNQQKGGAADDPWGNDSEGGDIGDGGGRRGIKQADREGSGGRDSDGIYMMSGGLNNNTPPPASFRTLDWLHKDGKSSNKDAILPRPSVRQSKEKNEAEGDLYDSTPLPKGRLQLPFAPRTFTTQATPTPASRHPQPNRMFVE